MVSSLSARGFSGDLELGCLADRSTGSLSGDAGDRLVKRGVVLMNLISATEYVVKSPRLRP